VDAQGGFVAVGSDGNGHRIGLFSPSYTDDALGEDHDEFDDDMTPSPDRGFVPNQSVPGVKSWGSPFIASDPSSDSDDSSDGNISYPAQTFVTRTNGGDKFAAQKSNKTSRIAPDGGNMASVTTVRASKSHESHLQRSEMNVDKLTGVVEIDLDDGNEATSVDALHRDKYGASVDSLDGYELTRSADNSPDKRNVSSSSRLTEKVSLPFVGGAGKDSNGRRMSDERKLFGGGGTSSPISQPLVDTTNDLNDAPMTSQESSPRKAASVVPPSRIATPAVSSINDSSGKFLGVDNRFLLTGISGSAQSEGSGSTSRNGLQHSTGPVSRSTESQDHHPGRTNGYEEEPSRTSSELIDGDVYTGPRLVPPTPPATKEGEDLDGVVTGENLFRLPAKDVDRPSACRLAKRLYNLDGFQKSDISKHLSKK